MGYIEQLKVGKISPVENPKTGEDDISLDIAKNASKAIVEKKWNVVDARNVFNRQASIEEIGKEAKRVGELCKKYMDEANPSTPKSIILRARSNGDHKIANEVLDNTIKEIQQHLDFIRTDGNEDLEKAKKKLESIKEHYIQSL